MNLSKTTRKPMRPQLRQTDLISIFGKRGSGKTTLCKNLQRAFPRVVVIDLLQEYDDSECDYRVTNLQDFARILIALTRARSKRFKIVFQFDIENSNDETADFDTAMHLLYSFGNCMVVIEEIHHYMRGEILPEWLRKVILVGRHRGLGIIATSQKPATVSKVFTSQCHHWFIARMFERNDLKYFSDCIGDAADKLLKIPAYHFMHYIPGENPKIIKNS
jgi:DNA helicase HerA-like ATPase